MSDHSMLDRVINRRTVLLLPAAAAVLGSNPLQALAEADALKKDMLKLKIGALLARCRARFRRT